MTQLRYVKSEMKLETITPAKANRILDENNPDNRTIKPTVVERYARDMAAGNWRVTADTVKFNGNGDLLDGQHRLAAAVKAGVPFKTWVSYGVESDAREAIDTGVRRTFADILQWKGETSVTAVSAAVRMGYRWQNNFVYGDRFGAFSHAEGLSWYSHNPSIRGTISLAMRLKKHLGIPNPVTSAFVHRTSLIDVEQADSFIAALDIGAGLEEGDPILALRNWLGNQSIKQPQTRFNSDTYLAIFIKAWNFWVLGKEINLLKFARGGTLKENMPQLLDMDGIPIRLKNELKDPVSIPVPDEYR